MAVMTKGYTFQNTSTVTAGTLHSLVESALLSGIRASDVALGTHFVAVGTATPNPSAYPFWYSLDPLDPVFRVWAEPFKVWLAVGPDRMEVPLLTDQTIPFGALVCSSAPSTCTLITSPSFAAVGFCQSTTASGAYAPIAMYGIGWALYISSPSMTSGSGDGAPQAGFGIKAYGCPAGGTYAQGTGSGGGSGPFFGMWLEGQRSGASGSNAVYRAMIWGTKLTVAP